jgi:RNA polymerase sigma-70 factor (ECF subfamily)
MQNAALSPVSAKKSSFEWEANLISWIARGDEAAFRLFYDATSGLLFGLLLRILGHTQTAEGVLTELYEEVRQKAARFGSQNERPVTWLIFIAHRRALEHLCRTLNAQNQLSTAAINITEQRKLIRAAMDSMSDSQQQIIEMSFFSGMTNREIAAEFDVSTDTIAFELRQAMLQLFELFRSMGFAPENTTETQENFDAPPA